MTACECDPTFPLQVEDGETCPPCLPYHLVTGVSAVLAMAWIVKVSWSHRGIPGWTYRTGVVTAGVVFALLRALRYFALAFLPNEEALSPLFWNLTYIIPTLAVFVSLNTVSLHWYRVMVSIDFSQGYRTKEVRSQLNRRALWKFLLGTGLFVTIEMVTYIIAADPEASPALVEFLTLILSPIVVGLVVLIAGVICVRSGAKIGEILKSQPPSSNLTPTRMNTLIGRVGSAARFAGVVALLGSIISYVGGGDSPGRFLIKSYLFRLAETVGAAATVSVYKLESSALQASLDRIKRRTSSMARPDIGERPPSAAFGKSPAEMASALAASSPSPAPSAVEPPSSEVETPAPESIVNIESPPEPSQPLVDASDEPPVVPAPPAEE